jgi:enoyl-CoA hydratase/carnithine racemase
MSHIATDFQDRILIIRLNRPEKKNALTQAMYGELADHYTRAGADSAIRAVLITGTTDCFSAGNDMVDFLKAQGEFRDSAVARFMNAMYDFHKPAIAAINGVAIGIGTTLLLHCDFVFAAANARFSMPFVNIGICPEFGSSYLIPALVGQRRAAELLLLGDSFSAQQALELGLVNQVLPDAAQCEARAIEVAHKAAAMPPQSMRTAKKLMRQAMEPMLRAAHDREIAALTPSLLGVEAREAMTAFMQKRKPDFSKFA